MLFSVALSLNMDIRYKIIKLLLKYGADPNASVSGFSFMNLCFRYFSLWKMVIKYGGKLDVLSYTQITLYLSFRKNNYKCYKYFIKTLNDPETAKEYLIHLLYALNHVACHYGSYPELQQEYIQNAISAIDDMLKKYKHLYYLLNIEHEGLDMKMLISNYLFHIENIGGIEVDENDKDYVLY